LHAASHPGYVAKTPFALRIFRAPKGLVFRRKVSYWHSIWSSYRQSI